MCDSLVEDGGFINYYYFQELGIGVYFFCFVEYQWNGGNEGFMYCVVADIMVGGVQCGVVQGVEMRIDFVREFFQEMIVVIVESSLCYGVIISGFLYQCVVISNVVVVWLFYMQFFQVVVYICIWVICCQYDIYVMGVSCGNCIFNGG